jgi:transketolase
MVTGDEVTTRTMGRDDLAITTIRTLAIDVVQKANSGHPGMPLGAAPMAHVLWSRFLRFDASDPQWPDRDRFVLSAGHASALLYTLLHLTGFGVSMEDLQQFRQWGSSTPGHPESHLTPGVEVTTGPLGQGFANGVGMAMAEAFLAATFNRPGHTVVDHRTYGLVSDGDLMEGIASEAASLAGHLGLGKLIYLYDDNRISLDGPTSLSFTEDVAQRFDAYGWHTQRVSDGDDLLAVDAALSAAVAETERPSLILVRTHIGHGSPNKQDTAQAHGSPLGEEEVRLTKQSLGWDPDASFAVPVEVTDLYRGVAGKGAELHREWDERLASYAQEYPDLVEGFRRAIGGRLPEGWTECLPEFAPDEKGMATRAASGKVLNALAPIVPTLLGGSADLAGSNDTLLKDCGGRACGDFAPGSYGGRNIWFGVREHAMGGCLNGMAAHGGLFPYGGTFFVFSDYMRPSVRLAALSGAHVVYVWTHDSVAVGEDGPTHEPVEHLAALRAMPGLLLIRPSDANETVVAWRVALEHREGPVGLVLTRQKVPVLDRRGLAPAEGLARGGYVLKEAAGGEPRLILLATGSEVAVALDAAATLESDGVAVRVVALPSWSIFEAQDPAYREQVLPGDVRARVAVEAASPFGWERYVGLDGAVVGIARFGASAPGETVLAMLGITPERVVEAARRVLETVGGAGA